MKSPIVLGSYAPGPGTPRGRRARACAREMNATSSNLEPLPKTALGSERFGDSHWGPSWERWKVMGGNVDLRTVGVSSIRSVERRASWFAQTLIFLPQRLRRCPVAVWQAPGTTSALAMLGTS